MRPLPTELRETKGRDVSFSWDIKDAMPSKPELCIFNQLHYGKEHNIQQGCRALEGRQEAVCQEIDIRSVCTPHPESSHSRAGRGNGYHRGACAVPRQSQIGIRPFAEDRPGHPHRPQDDSPFRCQVRLSGVPAD